jgi:hypothetical protein
MHFLHSTSQTFVRGVTKARFSAWIELTEQGDPVTLR